MKITTSENRLKIAMSKKEWLKIADENNVVLPSVKSLTVQDMVFKVGDMYKNMKGDYRIIGIDIPKNLIKVKYVGGINDGEEQVLDVFGQYKVMKNMQIEQDRQLGIHRINFGNDAGNYFTMGFLASHGTITVQTTDDKELETRKIYKGLTGQDFQPGQLEVVPHFNPTTSAINKYTHQFRIYFKKPSQEIIDSLTLPPEIDIKDINKNLHSINNNNYILNLLHKGFLVGNNSGNIDRIRGFVPKEFLEDFDAGVASA